LDVDPALTPYKLTSFSQDKDGAGALVHRFVEADTRESVRRRFVPSLQSRLEPAVAGFAAAEIEINDWRVARLLVEFGTPISRRIEQPGGSRIG